MAAIYEYSGGEVITSGLQGCRACDEALRAAERIAAERGEPVVLEDDDGDWLVHPNGGIEEMGPTEPEHYEGGGETGDWHDDSFDLIGHTLGGW